MAIHTKQIRWTPERLQQAIAMKTRWQKEDCLNKEDEYQLIWKDWVNETSLEHHLELWLYTHDQDTYLKWID